MAILELVAAVFGLLCVAFYIVRSIWSWPLGLVQVVLYIAVFWDSKLYADMALHVFYVFLQLYGWRAWAESTRDLRDAPSIDIVVQRMSRGQIAASMACTGGLTILIIALLRTFTDARSPEADSFVAAASLVAQYLLARCYLENWLYWIAVDTVGVGLFWSRGLVATSILYAIFWALAMVGFVAWTRSMRTQGKRDARA